MKPRSFKKFESRLDAIGLRSRIEARSLNMHVSLRDLYEGVNSLSIVAARRAVYTWLNKEGKSPNEIATLFDRQLSGVLRLLRGAI